MRRVGGLSDGSEIGDDMRTAAALAGFVVLGLSPSFVDWQQSPDKRGQIAGYYAVALALIWWGMLDDEM